MLAARHANNIVRLDLPRPEGSDDPYLEAGRLLEEWIREGVLIRDATPALYLCEQGYRAPSGERRVRRGLFARLRLEPLDSGKIIPHERTLDRPREDRRQLLASTRTHLSAVFLLHPDPDAGVSHALEEAAGRGPAEEFVDDSGTTIRMVRLEEGGTTRALADRLRDQWALIADGHHRYESALSYCETRRAGGSDDAGHVLAFLCSLEDPGLSIFPIHRVIHSLPGFDAGRFRERLAPCFTLSRVEGGEALRAAVGSRSVRPGVFGIVFPEDPRFWLAEWKEGSGLDRQALRGIPEPLRSLDVILLHRLVLEDTLGIDALAQVRQTHLDYLTDATQVFERAGDGRVAFGVLLNATRINQVIEVTRSGLRLPQKSTYFYPKVPTGLVLDPLDA